MYQSTNLFINAKELQIRIFYSFLTFIITFSIAFLNKVELFFIISKFFLLTEEGFIYINLLDPLIIYLKIAFLFSILFTFPIFFYLYGFFFFKAIFNFYVSYIFFYVLSLYTGGIIIFGWCYFHLFPLMLRFLIAFQRMDSFTPLKLVLRATMDKYFVFFYGFVCIFFFIFIFCNVFLFFIYANAFNAKFLETFYYRRFLYLFVILILLIFSPPDILIQLIILPFLLFGVEGLIYFVTFWYNMHKIYMTEHTL